MNAATGCADATIPRVPNASGRRETRSASAALILHDPSSGMALPCVIRMAEA
jgi:hypothetical protein